MMCDAIRLVEDDVVRTISMNSSDDTTLSCICTMKQNENTTTIVTCRSCCLHRLRCLPHRHRRRLILHPLPHGVQYWMTLCLMNA